MSSAACQVESVFLCVVEWVVQWVKTDLLDYNQEPSGFYVKWNGESDFAIFSHFRSS